MSWIGIMTACLAVLQPIGAQPPQTRDRNGLTPVELTLYDAHNRLTVQLSFNAEARTADELRSDGGAWFRATGNATDPGGQVAARDMTVELKLRLRRLPEQIASVAGAQMASFGAGQPVDLMRMATDNRDGSRRVTVVNFERQQVAEFRLGAEWFSLINDDEMAGLLAEMFGVLTTSNAGQRDVLCDPTYTTCWNNAVSACNDHGGVCDFRYSCDPQTGFVACSFTCCQIGGGGPPRDGGTAKVAPVGSQVPPTRR